MEFFISSAWADGAAGAGQGSPFGSLIFLGVFVAIFYFMLIRPQQKRVKEHKSLVESLKKGDEVVTSGGLLGKIAAVDETFVSVDLADNMQVKVQKNHIGSVMPKGTIKSAS